jgi:Uncharacterized protein conserved in bacteria (DUF2213)
MKTFRRLQLRGAAQGELRTEVFEGVDHLVVPVVALMEGVIFPVNAESPELVLAEDLAIAPGGWNGRPVFLNHPRVNGEEVLGNTPELLEAGCWGRVFNANSPEDVLASKRLKVEAWLNKERALDIPGAPKTIDRIVAAAKGEGPPVEVSVGNLVLVEDKDGTYNGEVYGGVWHNIVGDHLAILEEGRIGACSVDMGCGTPRVAIAHLVTAEGLRPIRENNEDEVMLDFKSKRGLRERLLRFMQSFRPNADAEGAGQGDSELHGWIDAALRAVEPGYWGIDEVFQDTTQVSYACMPEDSIKLYLRGYTLADKAVTLKDDREEVQYVRKLEPVASSDPPPAAEPVAAVAAPVAAPCGRCAEGGNMTKAERIAALIASGRFKDADKVWLENTPDEGLTAFEATPAVAAAAPAAPVVPVAPAVVPAAAPAAALPVAAAAAPAAPLTVEAFVASAPAEIKDFLSAGLAAAQSKKTATIATIKASGRNDYTDVELNGMTQKDLDRLVKLSGTVVPAVDFSGRGAPRAAAAGTNTDDPDAPPPPPNLYAAVRAASKKGDTAAAQ